MQRSRPRKSKTKKRKENSAASPRCQGGCQSQERKLCNSVAPKRRFIVRVTVRARPVGLAVRAQFIELRWWLLVIREIDRLVLVVDSDFLPLALSWLFGQIVILGKLAFDDGPGLPLKGW